jgi:uncharacterized RDD family membrane protein YckC
MTDSIQAKAPATANLLRRLMALLYDIFLLFAITLGYGGFLLLVKIVFNGTQGLESVQPGLVMQILSFLGWLASLAGYYFICWRKQGQTLGMKAWRLKLQNIDGTAASPEQCIKRSIFACFSLGLLGVGYLICLIPSRKTCLHDDLSNTEVVVLEKQK